MFIVADESGDLKSAYYNGSDINTVVKTNQLNENWGIAISDDFIFYASGKQILKINKSSGQNATVVHSDTNQIYGVVFLKQEEKYSYGRVNLGGWMLLSLKESVEEQLRQANGRYRIDLMEVLNAIASNNAHTFETHSKMYPKDPPFKTAVVFEH
ncbi:LRP5_6 [Mytilus edulis]|uniref:LRP5_6 n=1 Tax=Mytilus edulis TaxID=6550 RepID=A0A8S3VJW5_MYTED|nr:LRP5_6 [Mytilus edulis]